MIICKSVPTVHKHVNNDQKCVRTDLHVKEMSANEVTLPFLHMYVCYFN